MHFLRHSASSSPDALIGRPLDPSAARELETAHRRLLHVHLEKPESEGKCSAGYAQGQDVTIFNAEGVTIAHNTFKQAEWHYIQGGGASSEAVDRAAEAVRESGITRET